MGGALRAAGRNASRTEYEAARRYRGHGRQAAMSQEQPMPQNAIPAQQQISVRVNRMKRPPAFHIIGLPELIGLAGAALLALLTVFAWFYFYLPANFLSTSTQTGKQQLVSE